MHNNNDTTVDAKKLAKCILATLGEKHIERIARGCGFTKRLKKVTPLGLLVACISTLGASDANWLADILRSFNAFTGETLQYKPFHNQLRKTAFPEFLRLVLESVLAKLTRPILQSLPHGKLSMFTDILLHDGTSFALKDSLARIWPGRFTKTSPAAVELHVTMSALEDNPISIIMAPDKESERHFSPQAKDIKDCLLLEDRGYEGRKVFISIQKAQASFIIRGTKKIKPTILKAWDVQGRRLRYLEGKRLSWRMLPRETVDLEIEWGAGDEFYTGRLVAIYKLGSRNRKSYIYLHTNLSREIFSCKEVGQIYRLRWQVELLFKQWKSHANLHRFDTSKTAIAEGLIWASLISATLQRSITHAAELAEGVELSTQRAAAAAKHFLDKILESILCGGRSLAKLLRATFEYLNGNARRSHPDRDRKTGRLAAGLCPIGVLKN